MVNIVWNDPDAAGDGEDLDPRVEGALGELNAATDDINSNEKLLEVRLLRAAPVPAWGRRLLGSPWHDDDPGDPVS